MHSVMNSGILRCCQFALLSVVKKVTIVCAVYVASGLADGEIEIRDTAGGEVAASIHASASQPEEEARKIRGLHFVTVPSSENSRLSLFLPGLPITYTGIYMCLL